MRRSATAQCVVWLTCTPVCPVYATMLAPRPESSLRWCGAPSPAYGSSQLYWSSQRGLKTQKRPARITVGYARGVGVPVLSGYSAQGAGARVYLRPVISEKSATLVGLAGVLAVPRKPSTGPGAFGISMVERSVACSKVLVFSTAAAPSALTAV